MLASTPDSAAAAPGDLDTSFGAGGKVISPIGPSYDLARAAALQTDGKIVVAGFCYVTDNTSADFCLARYTSAGDLDTSFGTGGKVITNIGTSSGYDNGNAVAIQADGKIVVAGFCYVTDDPNPDFCLARYDPTGDLDAGFGTGGEVITPIGTSYDSGNAVAVQADGKIVVAGECSTGSAPDFCLARYSAGGDLDAGFGTGGTVISPIDTWTDRGKAVAVQADGKIVVAGECYVTSNFDFCLARYSSAGDLDAGFGTGGKVITPMGPGYDFGAAVAMQADGKIVVAGTCYDAGLTNSDFCLARYSAAGVLDAGFGTGGKLISPIGTYSDSARALAIQADGKIVVAGDCYGFSNSSAGFCLARYSSAGDLDAGFGLGGKVMSPPSAGADSGNAVVVQTDGKIVVAGTCLEPGSQDDFCVARYDVTGAPNATIVRVSFLHGTGPAANPPTLFLNATSPVGSIAKYRDSAAVNFTGGNLWKDVGTWGAPIVGGPGDLLSLGDLHVWLGLKNSDDQGTQFDLRAEVYKNGVLIPGAGAEKRCITGVTRNPNQAKEVVVSFPAAPLSFNSAADTLSVKLLTRIGTNPNDTKCAGHNNATGLRLYFDAANRAARFDATFMTAP